MLPILIGFGLLIYFLGILFFINDITVVGIKFHDNDTSEIHREITTKDARLSLIWPVFLILFCLKIVLSIINQLLYFIFLLVGYKYYKTKLYLWVNDL